MHRPRILLASAGLAAAAVLSSCSGDGDDRTAPTTVTTVATSTSPTSTSSSTTVVATTATTSRPATTLRAATPEGYAESLFAAWTNGDRAAAEKVAQPAAVEALFARQWRSGDGWSFSECSGAAGSTICTWRRPSGQQLLLRVQNVQPVTVSEVRFNP